MSSFSGEMKLVNTFAGIENPAGTVAPDCTKSAIDAALLPTIAGSRAEGVSSSTIKGAFWIIGIAMNLHALFIVLLQKHRRSNGADKIRAWWRAVASFCSLAEAYVRDCYADEDE
jgi:hypothetical protein